MSALLWGQAGLEGSCPWAFSQREAFLWAASPPLLSQEKSQLWGEMEMLPFLFLEDENRALESEEKF